MKCACGAELQENAKFCVICGSPVPKTGDLTCRRCGKTLIAGAQFCGNCGCKLKIDTLNSHVNGFPNQIYETIHAWFNFKIGNKHRAKKLLIIALMLGVCLFFTGLAGRIMMGGFANSFNNTEFVAGLDMGSDIGEIINKSARNLILKLCISVIKNDSSAFIEVINKMVNSASSISGDPYGLNGIVEMFITAFAQEAFDESRSALIEEAGALWPLLRIMAYCNEILIIGLIVTIATAVMIFLLDGKVDDIRRLNMKYVVYIGFAWSVLVIVMSLIISELPNKNEREQSAIAAATMSPTSTKEQTAVVTPTFSSTSAIMPLNAYLSSYEKGSRIPNDQVSVFASSCEPVRSYGTYYASNANDSNPQTEWVEGAYGSNAIGTGETLTFNFSRRDISGFVIQAGMFRSLESFKRNCRPATIRIHMEGVPPITVTLKDIMQNQIVLFTQSVNTSYLTIELCTFYTIGVDETKGLTTCIADVWILQD